MVEDKRLSLALHYRTAADPQAALARIDALLVGIEPALPGFGGKFVVNVVAAGLPDKGDALVELVRRAGVERGHVRRRRRHRRSACSGAPDRPG